MNFSDNCSFLIYVFVKGVVLNTSLERTDLTFNTCACVGHVEGAQKFQGKSQVLEQFSYE